MRDGSFRKFHGWRSSTNLLARSAQPHDQSHRQVVIAGIVGRGDLVLAACGRLRRTARRRRDRRPRADSFCSELCRAAGQVDDLAHQVGVDLGDELVEIQIEIVDAGRQLRGVVIAQIGRIEMLRDTSPRGRTSPSTSTSSRRRRSESRGCGPCVGRLKPAVLSIAGQNSV